MFQVPIEPQKIKGNQVTGMHLMSGLLLFVMGILTWLVPNQIKQEKFDFLNWAGLLCGLWGLFIIIVTIFFNKRIIQSKANFTFRILEIISLSGILIYTLYQKWYLPTAYSIAALCGIILAYYWERKSKSKRWVKFDDEGIHIKNSAKINWSEISHVIVKHNILTIDCKNNKLYQLIIDTKNNNTDAEVLESYARIQIKAKEHLYKKEW